MRKTVERGGTTLTPGAVRQGVSVDQASDGKVKDTNRGEQGVRERDIMQVAETSRAGVNGDDRTLAGRTYTLIHDAILKGKFGPGDRLRIEELAEIFQISPTPIREALYRLEAVGLIESIPHRGARVAELSGADLQELYEARLALEPLAVGKAASRFTPEIADKVRACLKRLQTAEQNHDFAAAWAAHTDFHFALYESSGSRWLVRLITPLWESSERYRIELTSLQTDLQRRTCEHESLLQACINHDVSRATAEAYDHLERSGNEIALQLTGARLFKSKKFAGPFTTAVRNEPEGMADSDIEVPSDSARL